MKDLEGYQVPVCQGLIKPNTIMGISREAMILNGTMATVFIFSLRLWYMFPVFLITHYLLYRACKKDPEVINIFTKHYVKQPDYFREG